MILFIITGIKKGMLRGLAGIIGMCIGIYVGVKVAPIVGPYFPPAGLFPVVKISAAFIVIMIFSVATLACLSQIICKVVFRGPLKIIDRSLGFFVGLAKGAIFVILLYLIVSVTPIYDNIQSKQKSIFIPYIETVSKPLVKLYKDKVQEKTKPTRRRASSHSANNQEVV